MNYSQQPPPPRTGVPAVLWVFVALGLIGLLVIVGAFGWGLTRGVNRTVARRSAPPRAASLPPVDRHVPLHDVTLLDGCGAADVEMIQRQIGNAIDVGAPLYNTGDFAGCYHMYDGTASDTIRQLSDTCSGPKSAFASGQKRAAKLTSPSAQAWAMRDTFDGLLDVIERRH